MLTDKLKTQASCADDFDSEALTVSDARQRILARITPVKDIEKQTLHHSLNRVLAQDIISTLNVPGHTNSAMDGYALAVDALPQSGPCQYSVAGTASRPSTEKTMWRAHCELSPRQ